MIKTQIKKTFLFKNELYFLSGIICCPYKGHYTSIIVNLKEKIGNWNVKANYFYDDRSLNHEVKEIDNYDSLLEDYLLYVVIYIKNY